MTRCSTIQSRQRLPRTARLIRNNHLYMPGWMMDDWLKDVEKVKKIVVCRNNGKPIGSGMVYNQRHLGRPNISVYVNTAHRRKGIGTRIMRHLFKNVRGIRTAYGIWESRAFFKKCQKEIRPFNVLY